MGTLKSWNGRLEREEPFHNLLDEFVRTRFQSIISESSAHFFLSKLYWYLVKKQETGIAERIFHILEAQDQGIDTFYVVRESRTGRSGILFDNERVPDEPFHNFRASKSVDPRALCSSWTSCIGF